MEPIKNDLPFAHIEVNPDIQFFICHHCRTITPYQAETMLDLLTQADEFKLHHLNCRDESGNGEIILQSKINKP